jgi:hypothetical protein
MITKPAVSGKAPITVTATGVPISTGGELVAVHYVNTTAGVGRVDIYDGTATPGNLRITLGAGVDGNSDDFCPTQPMKFKVQVRVVFTTGTGVVTLLAN